METATEDSVIIQKTRELCQAILEQPEFVALRRDLDAFLNDEAAKLQYQIVSEKGGALQHKQQTGGMLTAEEIADFEGARDAMVNNPVARGFLDAQQEIHRVQESVGQYVSKTFELGRLPTTEDFGSGCGPSCGCSH